MVKPPELSNRQHEIMRECNDLANYLGVPLPVLLFKEDPQYVGSRLGRRDLGRCLTRQNAISIRLRGETIGEIKNTLTHEFVHLKFRHLHHGVQFEKYIKAVRSRSLFFNGRGLVTEFPRPAPTKTVLILELEIKLSKVDSRMKRLASYRSNIVRKLNRMKANQLITSQML